MWIDTLKEIKDKGKPFVLATIIRTEGSTPREAGSRLIVTADGQTFGTVGGGEVEHIVQREAPEILRRNRPEILKFALSGETWQVTEDLSVQGMCGGSLEILVEPFSAEAEVVIFGGGHVGSKLAALCDVMEMPYRVYDNREEFASRERFPNAAAVVCAPYEETGSAIALTRESHCVILTHGHAHDHVVLEALLVQKALPYIGMIGSKQKIGGIIDRIARKGVRPDDRLYTPVGLNLGRHTPQEIALAILAEIRVVVSGGSADHCRVDWSREAS